MTTIIGFSLFVIIGIVLVIKMATPKVRAPYLNENEYRAQLVSSNKTVTHGYPKL